MAKDEFTRKNILHRCSFCGKSQDMVRRLVSGPSNVYICDECVTLCDEIMADGLAEETADEAYGRLLTPSEMKAVLDDYVIGQEEAKKALCVAVYNHYKRLEGTRKRKKQKDEVEIQKSNVLLIGPTGSGKTFLAQTLARILHVPFAIADATSLTEAGYVGEDVENILLRLYQAADGDIAKAERGIIYIDEIDKIGRKSENTSITRDVSGEGVQQGLLKILEGTDASVPPQGGRKHPMQEMIHINTTNILFIVGGAFEGLIPIIESRIGKKTLGFGAELQSKRNADSSKDLKEVQPEDLNKFGLIPEFVGRLPIVVTLDQLDEDALMRILTEPKNALCKQYQKLLEMDGVELKFEEDALRAIAHQAIERHCGARGLRAIIEKIMLNTMFELPGQKDVTRCTITLGAVQGKDAPKLTRRRTRSLPDSKAAE